MSDVPKYTPPNVLRAIRTVALMWIVGWAGLLFACVCAPLRIAMWLWNTVRRLSGAAKAPARTRAACRVYAAKGTQKGTLVLVHGFPDTSALFENYAERYSSIGYQCLNVELPGAKTDAEMGWGINVLDLVQQIHDVVVPHLKEGEQITYIGHDFGAVYCKVLHWMYPQLIARAVLLDVSEDTPTDPGFFIYVVGYQSLFATAFLLGGWPGNFILQQSLKASYKQRPIEDVRAHTAHYYVSLIGSGFLRAVLHRKPDVRPLWKTPGRPIFYGFGTERAGLAPFHSQRWLDTLSERSDCCVKPYPYGHWFLKEDEATVIRDVEEWLQRTNHLIERN